MYVSVGDAKMSGYVSARLLLLGSFWLLKKGGMLNALRHLMLSVDGSRSSVA